MLGFTIKTKISEEGKVEVIIDDGTENKRPQRDKKGSSVIESIKDYCVIDIETTGLDTKYDEIIEISALKVRDNEVVNQYTKLVKPKQRLFVMDDETDFCIENGEKVKYIDDFISELTGITNQMLQNAPDISEVLPSFNEFIGDDILIGHNVNFDINFIYDNNMEFLQKPFSNSFIDTLRIARKILPELKHHRLDDLIKYFNEEVRNEHRALNDCILTNEIYKDLISIAIDKFGTFEEFKNQCKKNYSSYSVRAKDIVAQNTEFDEDHPLYGKVCVFTGVLEKMLRKDAMQIVANLGGICGDSVTSQTNYLILGNNDYCKTIKDGKSNKQKKAEKLKKEGQDIEIISENVFYDMIETK
ncbi:MAG: exonuclease [Clostridia bacterium]|nr:exonuclease [Clostridia bacterium]